MADSFKKELLVAKKEEIVQLGKNPEAIQHLPPVQRARVEILPESVKRGWIRMKDASRPL